MLRKLWLTLHALVLAVGGLGVGAALASSDVLVIDLVNEPATLDPHKQWNPDSYYVYRNIYDNLVTRNTAGEIVPQIATSWKVIDDTTVEFKIRTDVKFHDGTPLTAEDVVFSIKRITDPEFKSPQLGQFNSIVDAIATAPDTVVVKTGKPYPPLLAQLVKLSIVSKAYTERVGDEELNLKPMGSGPFKFVEWQKGVKVVLEANNEYWRGKPPFARAEFRAVKDAATRIADLRTGKADLVVALNSDNAAEIEGSSKLKVLSAPTERVAYLMMNTQFGPLTDVKLRRAVAYGLDRQLIIDALLGGYARKIDVLLTPAHFGYVEGVKTYPYDPEKARALVAEAGYPDGVSVELVTAPVFDQRIVQAIQQQLSKVGITVEISMSDMSTFLKRRRADPEGFGDMVFGRWSCACQDADGVLYAMFHSDSVWSKYANPELDKHLEAARSAMDPQVRLKHYRLAHEIIADQVPSIPLYQAAAIYGARKELQWTATANESLFLMDMSWQE